MILRYINYLMIVLFALSAIVQYNDPNAVRWMLIYGAACIISILFAREKLNWAMAGIVAGICIFWAIIKIPYLTASGFQHMLDEVRMTSMGITSAREFLGLLIIAAWTTVLAVVSYRKGSDKETLSER